MILIFYRRNNVLDISYIAICSRLKIVVKLSEVVVKSWRELRDTSCVTK